MVILAHDGIKSLEIKSYNYQVPDTELARGAEGMEVQRTEVEKGEVQWNRLGLHSSADYSG
jgi:hypothetical protein